MRESWGGRGISDLDSILFRTLPGSIAYALAHIKPSKG